MKDLCTSPFVTVPLDDPSIFNATSTAENKAYAMVTVPWQTPGRLYSACEGLMQGTIFADLNQPYVCPVCSKNKKEACERG